MKQNKTVLITGAGSGIGRALANEAAKLGFDMILVGRTKDKLEATAALINEAYITIVPADITTAEGRAAIVKAAGNGLDILINNAGTLSVGHFSDMPDKALESMISTNLGAPIALTRDLLPALKARAGRIVNVGSVFGDIGFPFFAGYSATKFGLRGFSDAIRRELSGTGISVTYIAPRATHTAAEEKFAALIEPMNITIDSVERVASQAWAAILSGKRESFPKGKDRYFVKIQRLLPSLIDKAVGAQARDSKTRAALDSVSRV